MNKIQKEYQQHIDEGSCTASPEHGCVVCLRAQDAGIIPDYDLPDYSEMPDTDIVPYRDQEPASNWNIY